MIRNLSRKRGGALTCIYVNESQIHDEYSAIIALDLVLLSQVGIILVKDLQGTTMNTYLGAFIEDDPVLDYGDTAGDRAYVFGYAARVPFQGGAEAR